MLLVGTLGFRFSNKKKPAWIQTGFFCNVYMAAYIYTIWRFHIHISRLLACDIICNKLSDSGYLLVDLIFEFPGCAKNVRRFSLEICLLRAAHLSYKIEEITGVHLAF